VQPGVLMRSTGKLFFLSVAGVLAFTGCAEPAGDDGPYCEGKCDGDYPAWSDRTTNIVPEEVHEYLGDYQWGTYHLIFHMSRRWFIAGQRTRDWLDGLHEQYADLQEGDPNSGLEFLAMHRAMIEHLDEKFADVELPSSIQDGAGFKTMGEVLAGWNTDEKMIEMIESHGGDATEFKAAATAVRDWTRSEDEFGLFLQTTLRLSRMVDENNTEKRFYDQAETEGAGIHNTLHGIFSEYGSPIDVGDPGTNLSNQMFWGIHGWVEARWAEYETHHTRTAAEQDEYDHQLERFRLHMQLHSDFHEDHQEQLPVPPPAVKDEIKDGEKAFRNGADCVDLDQTVEMPSCT
jgi:hypothetical protein